MTDSKLIERRAQATTPSVDTTDLITIRRAHQLTGIPTRTLQTWAAEGTITAERDGPKLWLVSLADVQHMAATLKPGRKPK